MMYILSELHHDVHRQEAFVDLNHQADEFVLAFDFGGTKVAMATADLDGTVIEKTLLSTADFTDANAVMHAALNAGKDLNRSTQTKCRGGLRAVGVSTMGITFEDYVLMAPNVSGWAELRIPAMFRDAFPEVPIEMENDVKAAALAEVRKGALQGVGAGMYINLGTGIAVVFTLDGKLVRGQHGAAGEVAYALRSANEARGFSDGVAPFEESVGGKSIGLRATTHFGRNVMAHDLFDMYRTGDAQANELVHDILREMAFQVTNLIIAWDPEQVVIGGGMVGAKDIIFPYFEKHLKKFSPFSPLLTVAHFERNPALFGAIELAKLAADARKK